MFRPLIETWISDLWTSREWDQVRDTPKIEQAFAQARREATRWPSLALMIAALKEAPATPQMHRPMQIEWDKNTPHNRSLTAKSHITYNSLRLGLKVPGWVLPDSDAEGTAIQRMVKEIDRDEKDHAANLRRARAAQQRAEA